MSDLAELYQSVILDHNRNPRNFHALSDSDRSAEGYNPLCGDRFKVWVKVIGDRIEKVSFEGTGCAISKASASMMTAAVAGKRIAEVDAMYQLFHRMVTGTLAVEGEARPLGKLAVFSGVSQFPTRVKCASLSWHALRNALETPSKES